MVGIADSQGEMFVYYTYDEWGNPLETLTRYGTEEEQKIAEINPLRYRGYYYDSETGYYYLQSRYYNPEWGRFISPDSFSYIDNSTRIGFNAYIYCDNNPIMFADPTGTKKTNNVAEVIFKTLVVCIEIDALTDLFVNFVSIFDIDVNKLFHVDINIDIKVNFNAWFNSISSSIQKTFQETMLFLVTGINHFFDGIQEFLFQSGIKNLFRSFIDKPLEAFSNLPKLSWDLPAIKFAPFIGSVLSIFDVFEDVQNGILDITQGVILCSYNIFNLILEAIPGIGTILSTFGDIFISFSDIFFKYVNGEYI